MLKYNNNINYNIFFIKNRYEHFIHDDKNGKFKLLNFRLDKKFNYELYLIVNELYQHKDMNVLYYKIYIYDHKLYDESDSFIIKRKKLFQTFQKFNLGMFRLKHILNMKYKKSKNNCNLFGEHFKSDCLKLIDDGSKYTFDYFEMYNIVDSSFKNKYGASPIISNIKNPYTNKTFAYFNVINIYFLMMKNERIPFFFYIYFHNNLSKRELYTNYNINMFINLMKYKYSHFIPEEKIKNIDRMLEYYNYYPIIRKGQQFKLDYFTNMGLKFFLAMKIINHYSDNYIDIYSYYISDCRRELNELRKSNAFYTNYNIKTS